MTEAILVGILGIFIGCILGVKRKRRTQSVDPTIVAAAEAMILQARAIHEHQAIVGSGMVVSRILAFSIRDVGDFEAEIVEVGGRRAAQQPVHNLPT